jgi:hypothetical protein
MRGESNIKKYIPSVLGSTSSRLSTPPQLLRLFNCLRYFIFILYVASTLKFRQSVLFQVNEMSLLPGKQDTLSKNFHARHVSPSHDVCHNIILENNPALRNKHSRQVTQDMSTALLEKVLRLTCIRIKNGKEWLYVSTIYHGHFARK